MDINNTMDQNISTLFSNIESFTQDEGTLGKSITLGDKTIVPVISVSIGYGGGNSSGKQSKGNASTAQGNVSTGMDALGLGAKISTDAVLVVDEGNVSVIPITTAAGSMSQLMNKIPQMMGMGQSGQQAKGQSQQQEQGKQQGQ